ncbi:MAG TPA: hypothetical protein VK760_07695 [Candidatus Acidoferrales bacterium]|jgi:hypothetical protein|nr:hypothetical protein [Candidatus Acidoferrales bacterium]
MTTTTRIFAGVTALLFGATLTACGGSHGGMLPPATVPQSPFGAAAPTAARPSFDGRDADADADSDADRPDNKKKAKIKIAPKNLALLGTGANVAGAVTVSEAKYKGAFKVTSTCAGIATLAPASGKGPKFKAKVTPVKAGSCAFTFKDTNKTTAKLPVTVTTAALALGSSSMSPGSKSVKIVLTKVNGAAPKAGLVVTSIVNLTACSAGCTVAGPQSPPGSDAYALTVYDAANAAGNVLATGTTTATVAAAKANVIAAAQLSKVPKFLVFGAIPSGSAGTSFTHLLTLAVQDADHTAIVGTYATPVKVTDSDTSAIAKGSSLAVNGGAASRSVSLARSSDSLTLKYGGMAIGSVALSATATGASSAVGHFAPTLAAMVYTGPTNGSTPEIDLYNTTVSAPGNSGAFTLTQPGWAGSGFTNTFTYTLGGTANNCGSFSVTPASGTAAAYTVSVGASPVAGTCSMTLSGAPGTATKSVVLTFTTSSVGIDGKHRKP